MPDVSNIILTECDFQVPHMLPSATDAEHCSMHKFILPKIDRNINDTYRSALCNGRTLCCDKTFVATVA